jgi:hypothetical protein
VRRGSCPGWLSNRGLLIKAVQARPYDRLSLLASLENGSHPSVDTVEKQRLDRGQRSNKSPPSSRWPNAPHTLSFPIIDEPRFRPVFTARAGMEC